MAAGTDSHISSWTWMINFFQGVKFHIITDRAGNRILKLDGGEFGVARVPVNPGP